MKWDPPHAGSILISQRVVASKKLRMCDKCGCSIEQGESYLREAYRKIDGEPVKTWSYTLHRECVVRDTQLT